MKRIGNIFDAVVEPANLEFAFWKASRGKRARDDQRQYQANLDEELRRLREGLLDGSYPVGQFMRDPSSADRRLRRSTWFRRV